MDDDERRRHERKKKEDVISFHIMDNGGAEHSLKGLVIDGSPGGVRFRADRAMSKNTRLYICLDNKTWEDDLMFFIQDHGLDIVEMIGSVMWCQECSDSPGEFEVGTRFIGYIEQ